MCTYHAKTWKILRHSLCCWLVECLQKSHLTWPLHHYCHFQIYFVSRCSKSGSFPVLVLRARSSPERIPIGFCRSAQRKGMKWTSDSRECVLAPAHNRFPKKFASLIHGCAVLVETLALFRDARAMLTTCQGSCGVKRLPLPLSARYCRKFATAVWRSQNFRASLAFLMD